MNLVPSIMARAAGKSALYDLHPDLQYRYPILRQLSDAEVGMEAAGFKANAKFYMVQTWVHKAIKVLSDNISPLVVRAVEGQGQELKTLKDHPFTLRLAEPNPEMGGAKLWEEWTVDMMLGGEWGLEAVMGGGQIAELWPRQPNTFDVLADKARKRYRGVAGYRIDDGMGNPYMLPPEELCHFKFYNPLNIWRGLAPIAAVRMGVIIDQLAQSWTSLFFKNNARPDFALIAPQGLTRTERDEYMNELTHDQGGENTHRPIVLENGITDIKTFSFPPKDMEWLAQREYSRDEIGAIMGVPDEIMGYGRDTYENFDTADRVLWTLTISPLVRMRDKHLTTWARRYRYIEPGQRAETDLSLVPQLQEDRTAKVQQYVSLVQNRIPPQMAADYVGLGLSDIPEGDVVYVSIAVQPIGTPAPEPQPQRTARLFNKAAAPEYGSPEHEGLWKRQQARLDRPSESMQRGLKRYMQDQQNEVLRRLRANREFGRGQWVKNPDRIPSPEELFDYAAWVEEFKKRFRADLLRAVEIVGRDELARLGIDLTFDLERPEVLQGIAHILAEVAKKTNNTTWAELVEIIQQAERDGLGIPAIQELLSAYFGDRKSDYQTERIARTTMTGSGNFGSQEAWEQSNVVRGKTWISALIPGRTRDEHAAAHGQTVGIHEMFSVGGESLEYPGDPSASPGNIINCLCTQIAIVEE